MTTRHRHTSSAQGSPRYLRHRASLTLAVALLLGTACGGGPEPFATPSPGEVPGLERTVQGDPSDVDAVLLLAAAYRARSRAADAREILLAAREDLPDDPGLTVFLGVVDEDLGAYDSARDLYEAYLGDDPGGPLADEVRARLAGIRLQALRADVRAALAREAELADTPPDPDAVGVFPFAYEGRDPTWQPLAAGLAELLVTDLAVTGRLKVVERVQVRALLDEMDMGAGGLVEPGTAARSGRILDAGRIVQGRYRIVDGQRIGVDAAVVSVGSAGAPRVDPIESEDVPERLFDLEKRLALDLHAELGVELTPAERARVTERQTESVQALLAFGRGLMASDRGDFADAEAQFTEAERLDPGFRLAESRAQATRRTQQARSRQGTRRLTGRAARRARRRRAVQALRNMPASARQRMLKHLGARKRAVLAEVLGQDRVGTTLLLELVFRLPGGGDR